MTNKDVSITPLLADVNFPLSDAAAPADSVTNAIAYVSAIDAFGKAMLESTNIIMDTNGAVLSEAEANLLEDISIFETTQIITASTASTTINLALGSTIKFTQSATTDVTFTGLPTAGFSKIIVIHRIHDATTTSYGLTFQGTHYKEGGLPVEFSSKANAVDTIQLVITDTGEIYSRTPILDFVGSGIPFSAKTAAVASNQSATPFVAGIEAGQLLTTMADGSLTAVSVKTDGDKTLTSLAALVACNVQDIEYSTETLPATSTYDIDMSLSKVIIMTQDIDITALNVINADPTSYSFVMIIRIKDATATPRDIVFSNAVFDWDVAPTLTQTSGAIDIITVQCIAGVNILNVINNFLV